MGWVRACLKVLDGSGATFMRFMVVSGLRTGEAFDSFNLIIKLCREDRLHEYYNLDLEAEGIERLMECADYIKQIANT